MAFFQTLFSEYQSNTVECGGVTYHRFWPILVENSVTLRFKFIRSNSKFIQAIVISFPDSFKGSVSVAGNDIPVRNRFPMLNFWEDTAPTEFEVSIANFRGEIRICNGSDPIGTKLLCKHLSEGCAMIVNKLSKSQYRFHCHDHEFEGACDNLVFDLEITI